MIISFLRQKGCLQFFLLYLIQEQLMKSHSHILSESILTLRGDQAEGPEDLNLVSEQVSANLGHIYKWHPAVSP